MPTLLCNDHRIEARERIALASSLSIYLSFDGVLSAFNEKPEEACLDPRTRTVLQELTEVDGVLVGVMSGRSLADLRTRVDLSRVVLMAEHGMEIESESFRFLHPEANRCRAALSAFNSSTAGIDLLLPNIILETKPLSTTIHYRETSQEVRRQLETVLRGMVPGLHPSLTLATGELCHEIRPDVSWSHGQAIQWVQDRIISHDGAAIIIGDESRDGEIFQAAPNAMTIQLGTNRSTSASSQFDSQDEVCPFLETILELWRDRIATAARPKRAASASSSSRPNLMIKENPPIGNVRLRRAAIDRRRQADL